MTFTRRAAMEMTRRVESILRQALADRISGELPAGILPWSGTFHSIGNRLLRRFAHNLGLDPGFSVLDRGVDLQLVADDAGVGEQALAVDVVAPRGVAPFAPGSSPSSSTKKPRNRKTTRQRPG